MVRILVPAALFLVAGCKSEQSYFAKQASDVFYQVPNDQVDILFVVDDSASMTEEQQALSDGFTSFVTELQSANTDFHIGVISTSQEYDDPDRGRLIGDPLFLTPADDYVSLFQSRVTVGIGGSDKERGLEAAAFALSPEMLVLNNVGFLRATANLLVVIISDEDDCSDDGSLEGFDAASCYQQRDALVPVPEMVGRIHDSKNDGELVQIGAIIGPYDNSCAEAYSGQRYVDAVFETGGLLGKVCDTDWSETLYDLGLASLGILDQFKLSNSANVATIEVWVDDVPVLSSETNGWTYDWQYWLIKFHGDAVPARGSTIRIEYEIAPSAGALE